MNTITLEQLLRMEIISEDKDGNPVKVKPPFRISVTNWTIPGHDQGDPHVNCIIHADGHNSETLDFKVRGNTLEAF